MKEKEKGAAAVPEAGVNVPMGNREVVSDVFSMLMEYPEHALDVYNVLNGSHYEDPGVVQVERLKAGISLTVRNDASFLIGGEIHFYEHQSTHNPNMPLREVIYYTDYLKIWIKRNNRDVYGRGLVEIPTPHFVSFYNGEEKRPAVERMRLSSAFCRPLKKGEEADLEVRCVQYNLNAEENRELLVKSSTLRGYVCFVDKVRRYREEQELGVVIDRAMEECVREGVLARFFEERKDEVRKSMILDCTWEAREKLIKRDSKAEGKAEAVIELLKDLGEVPEWLENEIYAEMDPSVLGKLLKMAAKTDSIEEFIEKHQGND